MQVNTKEKETIVSRLPSDIFPEYILIHVNEFNKVALSPIEEWMSYLKNGKIKPDTKTLGSSEAREKLKYYSMSPKERRVYDEHLSTIMIQMMCWIPLNWKAVWKAIWKVYLKED